MRIGLALPHYDFSVPGEYTLRFETIIEYAQAAERLGFDSLWVSDHVFLDLAKYGGSPEPAAAYDPLVTLAALARLTERPRLGTLVLLEALRPPAVLAKSLASLARIANGRLEVGLGAGWYEPDYAAIGMEMPRPGVRLARLAECTQIVTGMLGGEPFTFHGEYHHLDAAQAHPGVDPAERPPVFLGGKGDRLLETVARYADGWNTCWVWTPEAYRERVAVLDAACERVGRAPETVHRSLGLYTLVGTDSADLEARFGGLARRGPAGVLDGVTLDDWRAGRLVGTAEEVQEQVEVWASLGVEEIICGVGSVPFGVSGLENLEVIADALCGPVAPAA